MNKLLSVFVAFFSFIHVCFAETVTKERAKAVAESFFAQQTTMTKTNEQCRLVWTFPESETKAESSSPLIYAIERNAGGFVLVSGDDAVRPILGYSPNDFFVPSEMPENMRGLIKWYSGIIECARVNGWVATKDIQEEWQSGGAIAVTKASNEVVLETAHWGQSSPYNDLCPSINGDRCVTGCAATALAIILRYFQWPSHGYGHLDSYYSWGNLIEGYDLNHSYDWGNMPLRRPDGGFTKEQSQAIAQLFYDVCVLCRIQFGLNGSDGDFPNLTQFCELFGYDKSIQWLNRQMYEDNTWEETIKKEIDSSRPVQYCGFHGIGHLFVIDGYKGRYFRINYGWAGNYNGYYTLTPIDGHRSDLLEYNEYQQMVCGIKPNKEFSTVDIYNNEFCNLTWNFSSNPFILNPGTVYNYRTDEVMDLCYVLYDKQWNVKEVISEIKHLDCSYGAGINIGFQCSISKGVSDGDRIVLATVSPYDNKFIPLTPNRQSQIIFLKRPLKELVEIGYSLEEEKPVFFMRSYKDLYWQIVSQTNPSWNCSDVPQGITYNEYSTYTSTPQGDSSDAVIRWFQLPKGTYLLKLKNFDEEATVEIKI